MGKTGYTSTRVRRTRTWPDPRDIDPTRPIPEYTHGTQ